jgi:hypothetical protein
MGNDLWAQQVRCCLRRAYELRLSPTTAHVLCFVGSVGSTGALPRPGDLNRCLEKCTEEQTQKCNNC